MEVKEKFNGVHRPIEYITNRVKNEQIHLLNGSPTEYFTYVMKLQKIFLLCKTDSDGKKYKRKKYKTE